MRKAFWIWNIPNCEGGDPLLIAAAAVKAGLTDVFVKVADGTVKFGVYNGVDKVPAVVEALRAVGVKVWGWHYVYGNNPTGEEVVATSRIRQLKLDAYIVDAEVEFKKAGWGARAETYLTKLRANNPGMTIAFSSYRFPHYHTDFPWSVFFKHCDINMPQVYWEQARNSGYQTQVCIDRFRSMAPNMPLMLAGAAYKWNGWQPSLSEVQEFERVSRANGIPLISYWSWEHCRRDLPELWPQPVVAPPPPPPPPGTPVPPPADNRMANIEKKVIDLEKALLGLATVVSELKTILKK